MSIEQIELDKLHANLGDLFKSLHVNVSCLPQPHFRPALLCSTLIKHDASAPAWLSAKLVSTSVYVPVSCIGPFLSTPFYSESLHLK